MTNRKNQNSILFLTTLGVLFFVAGVFAQPPEDKAEQDKQVVYINRRPMQDFANLAINQIQSGKINLEAPFRVVVSGKLASKNNATIVLSDAKIEPVTQPANSDPAMVRLAQEGIIAVSDAGWFGYLDKLRVKNIVIAVEQTGDTFCIEIRADQPDETNARKTSSALNALLSVGTAVNEDEDAKMLLSQTTSTSEGNKVIINFKLPKAQFQEYIMLKFAAVKQ